MTRANGPLTSLFTSTVGSIGQAGVRAVESVVEEVRAPTDRRAVPMDLMRTPEAWIARFDVPGVGADDIDVDVRDGRVTVRVRRVDDLAPEEHDEVVTRERPVGEFVRELAIGPRIDTTAVRADHTDGVLTLTIPFSSDARARKVPVES
ncbi:Hsp20/alpha crystallin family protein [Brevibacterium litoralis]|uniref:Hsp20/alpha crystallin family protein n=1 Tax=Brevibacterium litoralis TaxID=3138935 RepID=UPI0032EB8D17